MRLPFFLRAEPVDPRLRTALDDADLAAFRLITRVKVVVMTVLFVYVLITLPGTVALWPLLAIVGLTLSAVLHYGIERSPGRAAWHRYAFMAFDIVLLTAVILLPDAIDRRPVWPMQMNFRFEAAMYYFVFIGFAALTYAPRFVLWTGVVSAVAWGLGGLAILLHPSSVSVLDLSSLADATEAERVALFLHPNYVPISNITQAIVLILLVSTTLSIAVWRTKRLIDRQLGTERERANLSRYFSPSMVEELAHMDDPLGAVRSQNAAVLFADIRGFTPMAESMSPEATIALLREFHKRMATQVFACDGTLDKYMGDGLMATFGTPRATPDDAANALRCARGMIGSIANWNRSRRATGESEVRIGIGVHYGPVVLGDIGDERRLEFAVIGDTVNAASRLEGLTKEHKVPVLVSADLIEAAGGDQIEAARSDEGPSPLAAPLRPIGEIRVRGREAPIGVYALG